MKKIFRFSAFTRTYTHTNTRAGLPMHADTNTAARGWDFSNADSVHTSELLKASDPCWRAGVAASSTMGSLRGVARHGRFPMGAGANGIQGIPLHTPTMDLGSGRGMGEMGCHLGSSWAYDNHLLHHNYRLKEAESAWRSVAVGGHGVLSARPPHDSIYERRNPGRIDRDGVKGDEDAAVVSGHAFAHTWGREVEREPKGGMHGMLGRHVDTHKLRQMLREGTHVLDHTTEEVRASWRAGVRAESFQRDLTIEEAN